MAPGSPVGVADVRNSRSPVTGSRSRGTSVASVTEDRGSGKSGSNSKKSGYGCKHIGSKSKALIDRLKILVPYANVCLHRQALLQGRRGAHTTTFGNAVAAAIAAASGSATTSYNRESTPATSNAGAADGDRSRKRLVEEMPPPVCFKCNTPADRLHSCLSCDFFGCWRNQCDRNGNTPHIIRHLEESGHIFAIDFVRLEIYCHKCNDYIYDSTITSWLKSAHIRWHAALCDSAEPEAKRPRIVPTGFDLSPAQSKYLKDHGTLSPCSGIRGLYNLGATCYLSVVLQSLVHNPLVRGWMLSDGHHPSRCRVGRTEWVKSGAPGSQGSLLNTSGISGLGAASSNKKKGHGWRSSQADDPEYGSTNGSGDEFSIDEEFAISQDNEEEVMVSGGRVGPQNILNSNNLPRPQVCMACELESSFQSFYSGDHTPYGPARLLRTLWLLRSDLAGYGQQDAHECLMAMLDTLHIGFTENILTAEEIAEFDSAKNMSDIAAISAAKFHSTKYLHHTHLSPCPCLIHQAFAGVLQSTVTCVRCGNITHAHDPMLDISLDIPVPNSNDSSVYSASASISGGGNHSNNGRKNAGYSTNNAVEFDPLNSTTYRMGPRNTYLARQIDAALNEWVSARQSKSRGSSSNNSKSGQFGSSRHQSFNKDYKHTEGLDSSLPRDPIVQTSITGGAHPIITLHDCLAHYTRAERLQTGTYTCSRCKSDTAEAIKQLCIKELPPILTFQLKRFEHKNSSGRSSVISQSSKIDSFVRFPLHIDMTPYTASALAAHNQTISALKASGGNATTNTGNSLLGIQTIGDVNIHDINQGVNEPQPSNGNVNGPNSSSGLNEEALLGGFAKDAPIPVLDGPGGSSTLGKRRTDATHSNPSCQYTLFAIIDHVGHLDTGHYTAYAQHRGQWYRFDDSKVERVGIQEVLGFAEEDKARSGRGGKGKAYMAFYIKSVLDYHDGTAALASGTVAVPSTGANVSSSGGGGSGSVFGTGSTHHKAPHNTASGSPSFGSGIADRVTAGGMGSSNTRISESGEWIEDAGVVRTRINSNGDVKVERRGRKKGSTNSARRGSKDSSSLLTSRPSSSTQSKLQGSNEPPPTVSAVMAAAAMAAASSSKSSKRRKRNLSMSSDRGQDSKIGSASHRSRSRGPVSSTGSAQILEGFRGEEGEVLESIEEGELGEFLAQGTIDETNSGSVVGINPMTLSVADDDKSLGDIGGSVGGNLSESSDEDGEALWARMSKEKGVDDLVPMFSGENNNTASASGSSNMAHLMLGTGGDSGLGSQDSAQEQHQPQFNPDSLFDDTIEPSSPNNASSTFDFDDQYGNDPGEFPL